jgi:hypothetical protein
VFENQSKMTSSDSLPNAASDANDDDEPGIPGAKVDGPADS